MPRKRQQSFIPGPEVLRTAGIVLLLLAAGALAAAAAGTFLFRSALFTVRSLSFPEEGIGQAAKDMEALKGTSIFRVDLERAAARVRAKNPNLADVRVLRRLPDEIVVHGRWRAPEALVSAGGRRLAVARDGYLIQPPPADVSAALPLVRGLSLGRAQAGVEVEDPALATALEVIAAFRQDRVLSQAGLRVVDVGTSGRVSCVIGPEEARLEIILAREKTVAKLRALAAMIARGDVNPEEVSYVDLRFPEPVFGKKKAKP